MSDRENFERLCAEEAARLDALTWSVRRSEFVVWRWYAELKMDGVLIDSQLALTRRRAVTRAVGMLADERAFVFAALRDVQLELGLEDS